MSYGFTSSGTTHVNTSGSPYVHDEPKRNCDNCGSNQIVSNECQHCGTWYGYGQKPKPYKPQPINYDQILKSQKPEYKPTFFQRIFRRKT